MKQTVYFYIVQKGDTCPKNNICYRRGGPEICPPDYKESDDKTFYIYFFLRFMGTIMLSAGVTIMDPIALTMIQKYGGDFGRERLFSSIGMAIFSPITGMLIDMRSKQVGMYLKSLSLMSICYKMFTPIVDCRVHRLLGCILYIRCPSSGIGYYCCCDAFGSQIASRQSTP